MWKEVTGEQKQMIITKLKQQHHNKAKFAGIFLSSPFIMGALIEIYGMVSGELALSTGIPGMIVCVLIAGIMLFVFLRLTFPFQTDHVYTTDPMVINRIYRRKEGNIHIVECNNTVARRCGSMQEGDLCRFIHCGKRRLDESFETSCRFAVTDEWLK